MMMMEKSSDEQTRNFNNNRNFNQPALTVHSIDVSSTNDQLDSVHEREFELKESKFQTRVVNQNSNQVSYEQMKIKEDAF